MIEAQKEFLRQYNGNNSFLLSLKNQYLYKGYLSESQLFHLNRAMQPKLELVIKPESFTLQAGEVLLIRKRAATDIVEQSGYTKPFYTFKVIEVLRETQKAYQVKVRLSAQKTSWCNCCGLPLTDERSVIAGIGPICAENHGLPWGDRSLLEMDIKLRETIEVTAWLAKSMIKERIKES